MTGAAVAVYNYLAVWVCNPFRFLKASAALTPFTLFRWHDPYILARCLNEPLTACRPSLTLLPPHIPLSYRYLGDCSFKFWLPGEVYQRCLAGVKPNSKGRRPLRCSWYDYIL